MKNLFCSRLATYMCMKPPPFPSAEPPLIYRKWQGVAMGNGPVYDSDTLSPSHTHPSTHDSTKKLLRKICELLELRLHLEEERRYESDKEDEINRDWQLAAAVLDRICAVLFAVIFIGGTVIFFVVFAFHP